MASAALGLKPASSAATPFQIAKDMKVTFIVLFDLKCICQLMIMVWWVRQERRRTIIRIIDTGDGWEEHEEDPLQGTGEWKTVSNGGGGRREKELIVISDDDDDDDVRVVAAPTSRSISSLSSSS